MDNTIKPKYNLQLRKVGRHYMIVTVSRECVNMTDVFTLNRTAALLWQRVGSGAYTLGELVGWFRTEFGVDKDTALHDVCRQIEEWRAFGLIE